MPLVSTGFVQMSVPEERLNSSGKERRNFTNSLVVTVASYYSTTLKFSDLFTTTRSSANVCEGRLHDQVLDPIHLWQ